MTKLGMSIWKDLTTREMQAYGALCLHRFCKAKAIHHVYIDDLIEHLLSMLTLELLYEWERRGASLALNGRGWDPLPASVADQLPEELRKGFKRFVEDVVDIGFCDMYGAASTKSLKYVVRALTFLDEHGVERPDVAELFKDRAPRGDVGPALGPVFSQERYEQVRASFG
jgi:hypothetical protein